MKYITLQFNEDMHRDDIEQFKGIPGCTGVSAYKNTLNVYFKRLDKLMLRELAEVLQRQLVLSGTDVSLLNTTITCAASRQSIYEALVQEAES